MEVGLGFSPGTWLDRTSEDKMNLKGDNLIEQLTSRLGQPLPGRKAHRQWKSELAYGRQAGPASHNNRDAATLILLYQNKDCWHVPLTVRPAHLPDHGGQVSLPGGMVETGETAETAALRELEEELRIPRDQVSVLGPLSPLFVFVSNFRIWPFVAVHHGVCLMRPNTQEVAQLLEIPLTHLADSEQKSYQQMSRDGVVFRATGMWHRDQFIWGATAMILGEFLALLQESDELSGQAAWHESR